MGNNPSEVCFFMIVCPRDAVIADYAINSYGKLRDLDFLLTVYANCLTVEQQAFYFPRWKSLPYVDLKASEVSAEYYSEAVIVQNGLHGPYQRPFGIWDRELRLLGGRFIATVDADFEILNPRFVHHILERMRSDSNIMCFSTDATSEPRIYFDTYSDETIRLNARNHTWFCVYRREAFSLCQVSHAYFDEYVDGSEYGFPTIRSAWDCAGMFQKRLRELGYTFLSLPEEFRRDYVHYGAFSKNMSVTRRNVWLYRIVKRVKRNRTLRQLRQMVFFSRMAGFATAIDLERNRFHKTTAVKW
jgi:hypothetical protein